MQWPKVSGSSNSRGDVNTPRLRRLTVPGCPRSTGGIANARPQKVQGRRKGGIEWHLGKAQMQSPGYSGKTPNDHWAWGSQVIVEGTWDIIDQEYFHCSERVRSLVGTPDFKPRSEQSQNTEPKDLVVVVKLLTIDNDTTLILGWVHVHARCFTRPGKYFTPPYRNPLIHTHTPMCIDVDPERWTNVINNRNTYWIYSGT